MTYIIETNGLPGSENPFAYWREVVCETWFGLWAERDEAGPFDARIEVHALGPVLLASSTMPPHRLGRGAAEIARSPQAAYCLHRIRKGTVHGHYHGIEYKAEPGDLLLFDTAEPCSNFIIGETLETTIVHVPQSLINASLNPTEGSPVRLSAREGIGALLSGYMNSLAQSISTLGPTARDKANHILCDLIATAYAGSRLEVEKSQNSVREARLVAAKRYIAANLTDAAMGVGKLASHLGVSDRYIHKLFEHTGKTFSETLLCARLEACRAILRNPVEKHRTVADIAFGLGFSDLSWFYRCYRTKWGETPGDTRMRSLLSGSEAGGY